MAATVWVEGEAGCDRADPSEKIGPERYERRSLLITSNLVFSDWGRVFKNPLTTAAAIDRLVHHAVILEFAVPSFRTEDAQKRRGKAGRPDERPVPDPPEPEATV